MDTTPPAATLECVGGPLDGSRVPMPYGISTLRQPAAGYNPNLYVGRHTHVYVRDGQHLRYVGASEGW